MLGRDQRPDLQRSAGTNNQVVTIIKTAVDPDQFERRHDPVDDPVGAATVTLTNSGAPGTDFNIGGSMVIGAATIDGLYTGTVNVQVDYQ